MLHQNRARQNYRRINGCTHIGCQQIVWLIAYLASSICFLVFVGNPIFKYDSLLLDILLVAYGVTFLPIFICYVILVVNDPVDPIILQGVQLRQRQENLKRYSKCNQFVRLKTKHCLWCNRCTFDMYSHSFLLNNCISCNDLGKYKCLLIFLCLNTLFATIESLFIFLNCKDKQLKDIIISKQIIGVNMCALAIGFFYSFIVTIKAYYLSNRGKTQLKHESQSNDSDSSDEDP